MKWTIRAAASTLACAVIAGASVSANAQTAEASLEGEGISGVVTLTETPSGVVRILVEADGVPPRGHGFHIHETGECDPRSGFKSAGSHVADGLEHGLDSENGPHPGDLPNVYAQEDGIVRAEFFLRGFALRQGGKRLLDQDGSAVVLHAQPDDYETKPSGEAGARIACGVIEMVEDE